MESTDRQLRKQIHQLERLRNSQQGNPKYRVQFTDGTSAETATDSSIAFTITNSEYRVGDVLVTFNSRGKIVNVQPARASGSARKSSVLTRWPPRHPGEWWDSPNPLYAVDKDAHIAQAAPKQAAAPGPDKIALAKRLLEAHDALLATSAQEPGYDRNGQPLDQQAWTTWNDTVYRPAYTAFRTAMDAFRAAVPHHGIGNGRHPLNFRHECEAIIAAAARDAAGLCDEGH